MGWSWYLAVDMQCFTVAALVLPWYGRAPRAVVGFLVAQVALSVVTSAALSSAYQAGITTLDPAYSKHIYPMPYTRCGAYAIGSLLGVLLHERGRAARGARAALPADARAVEEAAPARRAGWWAAGCLLLPLVFLLPWADLRDGGLFEPARQHWAQWQRDAYTGAQRPLWAAGLSALALCLIDGRRPASTMRRLAAPLDALLSHPAWEVLGKLSYGAYLWHLVVILALYYSALDFQTFSRVDVAIGYVALLLTSFALALCSYLLVEKPAMNLEGALLGALLGAPPSKRQRAPARAANPALAQALLDPVAHADAASSSHPAHADADAACLPSASSTGLRWRPTTSDEAANAEPAAAVAVTVTGFT
jgi:peptidoglycan/LPS O-acetylase OafA/YrhL